MVDFKFFADESGADPNNCPTFVQAGYVSTIGNWETFTEQWEKWMRDWAISSFHMTEAEARDYAFSKWTESQRDSRVAVLSALVSQSVSFGIACRLRWEYWKQEVIAKSERHAPIIRRLNSSPYLFSTYCLLILLMKECQKRGIATQDMRIVLAKRGKNHRREVSVLAQVSEDLGFEMPHFESADKMPPLQAADMLAWCYFQLCSRRQKYGSRPKPRHSPLFRNLVHSELTLEHLRLPVVEITAVEVENDPTKKPTFVFRADEVKNLRYISDEES